MKPAGHVTATPLVTSFWLPAALSVFRIGEDGRLSFVRSYPVEVAGRTMFWMGMVPLTA